MKKIIFGSFGVREFGTNNSFGSGYENISNCVDGVWRNLEKEIETECDVVLCCCANILVMKNKIFKRPKKWKKFIVIQEAGTIINNHELIYFYLNCDLNIDGHLVHSKRLTPFFEIFQKPVYYFNTPYPFEKVNKEFSTNVYHNKIHLNMSRMQCNEANMAATLRVCQLLPEYNFITYCGDSQMINNFIQKLNIKNWKVYNQLDFKSYLNEIKDCGLFVSLDNRQTWGRFQLDAAALNKRSVGVYSETQEIFFPKEYMVESTEIYKLVELIKEHFGKPYKATNEMIQKVSYDSFKKVLNDIVV